MKEKSKEIDLVVAEEIRVDVTEKGYSALRNEIRMVIRAMDNGITKECNEMPMNFLKTLEECRKMLLQDLSNDIYEKSKCLSCLVVYRFP